MTSYPGPAERLERYESLVATQSDVDRKGVAMPYTSRNGHMFSFLTAGGAVAIRLPKARLTEFLSLYDTEKPEQHGTVMKEYATVPDDLLDDLEALRPWFQESYEWVGTLRPKKSRKKK